VRFALFSSSSTADINALGYDVRQVPTGDIVDCASGSGKTNGKHMRQPCQGYL
jgi:hypothetical protein